MIILPYSAKKNNANAIAEYSTLYPATSSASASGKSKGVRFVSARAIIKNNIQNGSNGNTNQTCSCILTMSVNEKLPDSNIIAEKVAPIESSYEIIWEPERIPPKKAYLELLDHPEKIIPCTLNEDIDNINNVDNGKTIDTCPPWTGIVNQISKVQKKVNNGAPKKRNKFALDGKISSFINNFNASAIGCSIPNIPAILGPLRRWTLAIVFLSKRVKKAIVNITEIATSKKFNRYITIWNITFYKIIN